ncbi:hypothetical protein [Caballeronia terrestris]|uniref:hypothetical protein n=1 Tax=Caballeronia terrestris TaxID=1226301 RepID=UPI000B3E5E07|nr:hypothetical protein [Caballeronia terrestris]
MADVRCGQTRKDESGRAELTQAATPAATPAAPASYAPAAASAFPAANEPVVSKIAKTVTAAKPVAAIPVDIAARSKPAPTPVPRVAATTGAVAKSATADVKTVAVAQRTKSTAEEIYPTTTRAAKKARRTARQSGVEELRGKRRGAAASAGRTRGAGYDRLVAMRDGDDVIEQDTSYRRPARAVARQPEAPVARPAAQHGMSVAEMYNMLQHSPTLDDNSSLARPSPRGQSSAVEPSSGNLRLSKQRVTDAPGDFTK